MKRMRIVPLLAAGALSLPLCAQGQLLDDFNDGNDDGWTRFTLPPDQPGAVWDASTGVYRLSVPNPGPQATLCSTLAVTGSDPNFSNGYWWATVVRENNNSTTHLYMRAEAIDQAYYAYAFGWSPNFGGLYIYRLAGGGGSILASDDTIVQDVGVEYILEAGAIGTSLEARLWPAGTDRPDQPQLKVSDSTFTHGVNGIIAQSLGYGVLSATFDDVSFIPSPAALPLLLLGGLFGRRREHRCCRQLVVG